MPLAIVALLALVLGAAAIAFEGGGSEAVPAAALRPAAFERIVERVERERGLDFERVLRPSR